MGRLDHLGEEVLDACAAAQRALTLCAPFVKQHVFERILEATSEGLAVELFTRWRPEEVAAGVSDTGVLELALNRSASVFLCDRLHAKFVRADDRLLVGSANLTGTALGWNPNPNLELFVDVPPDTAQVGELEAALRRESILATAEIAAEIERIAAMLPRPPLLADTEDISPARPDAPEAPWLPTLREPRDLYRAYSTGADRLSRASAAAAAHDLLALELPNGLGPGQFDALVASRLMQNPVVRRIDALVAEPQRFGAVRGALQTDLGLDRESADFAWQTLMRWLLEFLPARYEQRVANYSEIFARRPTATIDGS